MSFAVRRSGTLNEYPPSAQIEIFKAAALRAQMRQARKGLLDEYRYELAKFMFDCVEWPEDRQPNHYQIDLAVMLYDPEGTHRIAEYGPHGIGKTALMSLVLHHFCLTSEAMEVDWKAITTAGSNVQLKQYLWPEVHIWAGRLKWSKIGREPYTVHELQDMSIKLRFGRAFAVNSKNYTFIEGAHAKRLLYMFDEAKAVPDETFDAAEGAFANVGTFGYEAYAAAFSTPGDESGRFYEICTKREGLEDWQVRHVTPEDSIKAGMTNQKFIDQRRKQWGEESQIFQNRILGQFSSGDPIGVIPLAWVEAAIDRWREWTGCKDLRELVKKKVQPIDLGIMDKIGVDVAYEGGDKSVIAPCIIQNGVKGIWRLYHYDKRNTMEIAGRAYALQKKYGGTPVVDTIGMGQGVHNRLIELKSPVKSFCASERTDMKDATEVYGFINKRAAAWWRLRESLDPDNNPTIRLPPHAMLQRELTAPRWWVTSGGKYQIEEKKEVKKRLKRSTDFADAVIQALFEDEEKVSYVRFY